MTFHVGQKVVCVDDTPVHGRTFSRVVKGNTYVVTEAFDHFGEAAVLLHGVDPGQYPGWYAYRFRPLIERKTDISIFTEMLTPVGDRTHVSKKAEVA